MDQEPQRSITSSLVDDWRRVRPLIRRALKRGGDYLDEYDVWMKVVYDEAQFWATPTSFVITEVVDWPKKRVLRFALAGGNLQELLQQFYDRIIVWAKQNGCVEA